jgi:hypothetical protein
MVPNDINRHNYNLVNYCNVVTLQSRVLPEKLTFLSHPVAPPFHETGSVVNLYRRHTTDACHDPHESNLERLCQISKSDSWISTCPSVRRHSLEGFVWNLNKMSRSTSSCSKSKENNVCIIYLNMFVHCRCDMSVSEKSKRNTFDNINTRIMWCHIEEICAADNHGKSTNKTFMFNIGCCLRDYK